MAVKFWPESDTQAEHCDMCTRVSSLDLGAGFGRFIDAQKL